MIRGVSVVYDDSRKPGRDIALITGNKSFAQTIYKRQTLKERVAEAFLALPGVEGFYEAGSGEIGSLRDTAVILFFSDFGIADTKELEIIVYKAGYAHENYKITHANRIACVIFKDPNAFFTARKADFDGYTQIECNAFTDLSDIANFRSFITGGFDARFFNRLTGDEYTVVKSSPRKEKIRAEYTFWTLLPDDMKQWFARPFDYREDGDVASYSMQRYNMTDLAIRYVHGSISCEEFSDILKHLLHFLSIRKSESISQMEYEAQAKRLYVSKVHDRVAQLKGIQGYDRIAAYIPALTRYRDIDEIVTRYDNMYDRMRSTFSFEHVRVVSHGDMCFSNILYSPADSMCILVDPKGALTSEELFMDPFYDVAKLSHSVCGLYDLFNSDLYWIGIGDDMLGRVTVDTDNRRYVEIFRKYLDAADMDFKLIRLYEASLFLSMLPLHADRPKKVLGFILNAIAIMDSLEK